MTRLGVLTTSFPRWQGDFAGSFVEDAVRRLAAAGAEVDVIAAGDDGARSSERAAHLGVGVTVHRIALRRAPGGASRLFFGAGAPEALERGGPAVWLQGLEFWAALCSAVRALSPRWSRVEAHWLIPCGLAARAVAPRIPVCFHAHSGDVALLERLPAGPALARYLVRPARAPSEVVFASRDLKERFARLTGVDVGRVTGAIERGALSPSGVAAAPERDDASQEQAREHPRQQERQRARRTLGLSSVGPTVLSVGRLVPIKGYDVLVRAVAACSARVGDTPSARPRPTVVIVGDGPERPRLEALARRLDVDLRLPGLVPRDEVATWLAGADLYVQPSRRLSTGRTEGLPVSTLEALAAGLPVVASATGGLAELPLGPPRLRLVPPGDAVALAACLEMCPEW